MPGPISNSETAGFYRRRLAPVVAGRKVILAVGSLTDSAAWLRLLHDLGSEPPFLLVESLGAGTTPDGPELRYRVVGAAGAPHQLGAFKSYRAALGDLPEVARRELDAYDPNREALVLVRAQHQPPSVGGRQPFAPRPEVWQRLEDKMTAHELWSAAELPQAPCRIVEATGAGLLAASRELDRGDGVVWSGDDREGYNAGADFVRWVRSREDARSCLAFFRRHCDRVRVMQFLEGQPCSVHGIVFEREVAVFRPVELVVLRERGSCGFRYAGNGTYWSPPPPHREEIRGFARRLGGVLRERAGFRGGFTLDGILTGDGFRATEINPRTGAALWTIGASMPELPLELLEMCVRRGLDLDYRPGMLESLVLEAIDAFPRGGGWSMTSAPLESGARPLAYGVSGFRFAAPGERADALLETGPSGVGGVVRVGLEERIAGPKGTISARVAEAFAFLDREVGTGFGPLDAPRFP